MWFELTSKDHDHPHAGAFCGHHSVDQRPSLLTGPHKLLAREVSTIRFTVNVNRLTPNDPYMGRTTPLTSKYCILYIYSTNVGTEYFKHALYSPFFFSSKCSLFQKANLFGSCIIHILYTGCAKIKKIIPAPKV